MIKRLMVGSEGTLGFVSQVTYNTVPEWPHKASAFVVFPDVMSACQGASGGWVHGGWESGVVQGLAGVVLLQPAHPFCGYLLLWAAFAGAGLPASHALSSCPRIHHGTARVDTPTDVNPCRSAHVLPPAVLRDQTSVDAVEMFDRASLRECESNEDMLRLVPDIKGEEQGGVGGWVCGCRGAGWAKARGLAGCWLDGRHVRSASLFRGTCPPPAVRCRRRPHGCLAAH